MEFTRRLLRFCGSVVAIVLVLVAAGVALQVFGTIGLLISFLVLAIYGWVLATYVHYQLGRRDEFLHVLTLAAESNAPLVPTLWAYLLDRPRGSEREFWVATLLFFLLPGYYWIWHRQHSFDRRVARVAYHLENGASLEEALRGARAVASPETRLAVAIGRMTGNLATCLRSSAQNSLSILWMETIPRLVYPLVLLVFLSAVAAFWSGYIAPRFERVLQELHIPMPELTRQISGFTRGIGMFGGSLLLGFPLLVIVVGLLYLSTTARWYCPLIGRVYRMHVRSRILRTLSVLLGVGRPAPEALALLAHSDYFSGQARRRLRRVWLNVEQGEPLAPTLYRKGLLPASMLPLLQSAERTRNLPWALGEVGEGLGKCAARLMQRLSLAVTPISVVAIGLLVALLVVGMFLPLVKIMMELSG